jgi:hypothetical protein
MAVDWSKVSTQIMNALVGVLAKDWKTVEPAASAQIAALVQIGQTIEAKRATMTSSEYEGLRISQQRAMEGILASYAAITIVVAEQAAAAAWSVIAQALKTAYALPFIP